MLQLVHNQEEVLDIFYQHYYVEKLTPHKIGKLYDLSQQDIVNILQSDRYFRGFRKQKRYNPSFRRYIQELGYSDPQEYITIMKDVYQKEV